MTDKLLGDKIKPTVSLLAAKRRRIGWRGFMREDMNIEQTKEVFLTLAMFVHGYASIIANNSLEYDEKLITTHLERVYIGVVLAIQEEMKDLQFTRDSKKSAVLTLIGMMAMILLTVTKVVPSSKIAGYLY